MSGARLVIKPTSGNKIDGLENLNYVHVSIPEVDYSPRSLGYDYDTWEDYYDEYPDDRLVYCEFCGCWG